MKSISTAVAGAWVLLIVSGCSRTERDAERSSPARSATLALSAPAAPGGTAVKPEPIAGPSFTDGGPGLKLDRPSDLGPAGSLAVGARGAVFRTRTDELALALLDDAGKPAPTSRWGTNSAAEDALASRAPPPALTRSHAYWVTHGKLVRRPLVWPDGAPPGALEVLTEDALDGTRVAADTAVPVGGAARRDLVIYIAQAVSSTEDRRARLWAEGSGAGPFSSDGSGASSVALARAGGHSLGISLDARSAMSPVHARVIDVGASGAPRMGADVVVFVGPSPEGHTEIAAAPGEGGPTVFIPFARDTTSFGLASLFLGDAPHLDAPVHWSMYPNGIEPAPVAAATFCGHTWVAYVRPSVAAPNAQSVLVLAPLDRGAFGTEMIAGQGFDFTTVSLAPRDEGGAWLAWVGNARSWVRSVRC